MTQCSTGKTSLFDRVAQLKVRKIKRPEGGARYSQVQRPQRRAAVQTGSSKETLITEA